MKRLLLGALLLAAGLLAACGDNGSSDESASPTAGSGSPSPAASLSVDQVITLTREYPVMYKADNPDGTFRLEASTMDARVDLLCVDDPSWSAEDKGSEWRVNADCRKDESVSGGATPPPYGFETLNFEWIFYPDSRQVMPVSQAAHDAQYPFPQPGATPLPTAAP